MYFPTEIWQEIVDYHGTDGDIFDLMRLRTTNRTLKAIADKRLSAVLPKVAARLSIDIRRRQFSVYPAMSSSRARQLVAEIANFRRPPVYVEPFLDLVLHLYHRKPCEEGTNLETKLKLFKSFPVKSWLQKLLSGAIPHPNIETGCYAERWPDFLGLTTLAMTEITVNLAMQKNKAELERCRQVLCDMLMFMRSL